MEPPSQWTLNRRKRKAVALHQQEQALQQLLQEPADEQAGPNEPGGVGVGLYLGPEAEQQADLKQQADLSFNEAEQAGSVEADDFNLLHQAVAHADINEIISSDEDLCAEDLVCDFFEENLEDRIVQPEDDPDDPGYALNDSDDEQDEDEDQSHFSFDDEALNTQVNQGRACTRRELLLLNLAVASKHNATYEMLIDMLKSCNAGYGRPGLMPTSKKALRKLLMRADSGINKHAYCPKSNCKKYLGKLQDLERNGLPIHCDCGQIIPINKLNWFVSISLKKQLENFLTTPGILGLLNYRNTRERFNENGIEDIFDGELYQEFIQQGLLSDDTNNFSFVFNTDGFSLYKNRSLSIWALLIRLNELPPGLRQRHLFLAGIWCDKGKPNMNAFLRPFVKQVNRLSTEGVQWRPDNGEEITSKFYPIACCVDLQARCMVMNMMQYNGQFGCFLCTHYGIHLGGSRKYPILPYANIPNAQDRSDVSIRAAMQRNEFFEGQLGPSVVMLLRHFDLARGNGIDDLHAYYEGVADFLFENVIAVLYDTEEAFNIIDLRMKSTRSPIQISRKWTSIRKRATFKGSQWGTFIRYFASVCLHENNLDDDYVELVSFLSYALFVLSRDSITPDELNRAEEYIGLFLQRFQASFGAINMRPNVHLLSHAVNSVRSHGPTWTISCFNFESWNAKLGKNITSPKGVFDQMVDRHFLKILLHESLHRHDISDHIREELQTILFSSPRKEAEEIEEAVMVLGIGTRRRTSEEEQRLLLEREIAFQSIIEYDRLLVRGVEYRNKDYHNDTLSDNSCALTWEDKIVTINKIIVVLNLGQQTCVLLVNEHEVDHPLTYAHHVYHLIEEKELSVLKPKLLRVPAIKMSALEETYAVPMANTREID
ncbi:High glucose sensor RGT2 [Frankliniella fusca]|uniref:High glucose sensor RGT2 n=1 Tax=Frankliniella fusca TaxID=407009 RepID=A0AAE1HC12_9NEOP|nr:High glucose sensor RGT2 [Frankliniella fusca]